MEQRGAAISDGSPLLGIKRAVQQVREELVGMQLEVAVLRHTVDTAVLKRNALYAELETETAELMGQMEL